MINNRLRDKRIANKEFDNYDQAMAEYERVTRKTWTSLPGRPKIEDYVTSAPNRYNLQKIAIIGGIAASIITTAEYI